MQPDKGRQQSGRRDDERHQTPTDAVVVNKSVACGRLVNTRRHQWQANWLQLERVSKEMRNPVMGKDATSERKRET